MLLQAISTALVVAFVTTSARTIQEDPGGNEGDIRGIEQQRFEAMTKRDVHALDHLLSADLVYTHGTGWRQNKTEFLASIRSGEILYHSITSEGFKVNFYGSTAVVTGKVLIKANNKGQEMTVPLLYLEVFAKQDGRWQLVAWESTRQPSS